MTFTVRKAHIKRIHGKAGSSDTLPEDLTDEMDVWLDVWRPDEIEVFQQDQRYIFRLKWLDTLEDELNPVVSETRRVTVKKVVGPDEDPKNPGLWVPIELVDSLIFADSDEFVRYWFKNKPYNPDLDSPEPNDFRAIPRDMTIMKVVHWDTRPSEEKQRVDQEDYERIEDSEDTGQYVYVEVPKRIATNETTSDGQYDGQFAKYRKRDENFLEWMKPLDIGEEVDRSRLVRLDPWQQIVNCQLLSATEVQEDSRVTLEKDLGTTTSIVIAMAFKITKPPSVGAIPLITFGEESKMHPGGTVGPPINTAMDEQVSGTSGVFLGTDRISITVAGEDFLHTLHLCSFGATTTTFQTLQTTAASNGSNNLLHFGTVPPWAGNATKVNGPGLPTDTTVIGWFSNNLTPPAVTGDVALGSIPVAVAGQTYTFTVVSSFGHSPAGDRDDSFNVLNVASGEGTIPTPEGVEFDGGWTHMAICIDTSTDTDICYAAINGQKCSPEPPEHTRRTGTGRYGGYVEGIGACPANLLYNQPGQPYPVYIEIPAFEFQLGPSIGLAARAIDTGFSSPDVHDMTIGYCDVQVWVGQTYDVGENAKKFVTKGPKPTEDNPDAKELLLVPTSVIQEVLGVPDIWLTGSPNSFIINRGTAGDVVKTGELKTIKGPKHGPKPTD